MILGEADLLLTISRIPFRHTFQVVLGGDLLLMGADFMAPQEGNVCPRVDKGDGVAGFCTLNHPTYGRIRLPLTTKTRRQHRREVKLVLPQSHLRDIRLRLCHNTTCCLTSPPSE